MSPNGNIQSGTHIQGKNAYIDNTFAHVVGNGISNMYPKNIHTVDWDGNAMFAGDVQFKHNDEIQSLSNIIKNLQSQIDELKK